MDLYSRLISLLGSLHQSAHSESSRLSTFQWAKPQAISDLVNLVPLFAFKNVITSSCNAMLASSQTTLNIERLQQIIVNRLID